MADPIFLSIIDSDKTIPVIARYWAHVKAEDFVNAGTLHKLFEPLRPAPSSTKDEQVSDLMNVFSKHLDMSKPQDAHSEPDLLSDLLELDDEDVMYGAIENDNLWLGVVGYMNRFSF
ncbi:hypothetical protein NLI96_g12574 [Meripilus lineatus]|uniref:Uncharacterized protein n=1 Tax=Meripilus lineatus TaxID=2056292 RepID=A0AAD5UPU6_9APHY|nr:hypothetical protein NLI96_g12574 [Physisporinus lineatus]